ncbi:PREDICTED: uncharacterized protein LOC108568513 [Nicrophorus vespilloides]|uniref:Uncharacterized protein LOC108568513 n=1 Tax=Nicrophorus vespilloides TaxID=110193 RepID=A0ABM1NEA1_NICVS|nr:PREDICTED: uncharacterized protein LOC108568513 [Nicrophorus vespilloides]
MLSGLIKISALSFRLFNTSSALSGQEKIMQKLMNTNKKKKRFTNDAPLLQKASVLTKGANEGKKSSSSKRIHVLNKLFMKYITDLMATGEYSQHFLGHGIEINRVRVTPDFQMIHVFWLAKGTTSDQDIEAILEKHAGALRHEITQVRIVGEVPKIQFFKDKQFTNLAELDLRLSKADFGEDYEPIHHTTKLKTELKLDLSLEPAVRERIEKLDLEIEEESDEILPDMPQNVLGLDHGDIMERVRKSMKKTHAVHRLDPDVGCALERTVNSDPIIYPSMKAQREAFKDFLNKRQLLKSKAMRPDKNHVLEQDYLEEEWNLRRKLYEERMQWKEDLDDYDYLDDNDETTK